MDLYMAVSTDLARFVLDHGFVGRPRVMIDDDHQPTGQVRDFCEFRDVPPIGLTLSRTAELRVEEDHDDAMSVTIEGGATLLDDLGDFVLALDVPDDVALEARVREEPGRAFKRDGHGRWVDAG